jgi:Mg-chelatase subunit ChlD
MPRSLHVQADRSLILADGHSRRQRHLRVDIVAPRSRPRAALSLGLVLDRSGSMAGPKLNLAREGAVRAIRSLGRKDRLSVVTYNDEVLVLLASGAAEEAAKRTAELRLRQTRPGGNTDLCGGWLRGCEQVGLGLDGGRLGRCLLLTDGLANLGITDRPTIVGHAAELRKRGVTTSTLGVGRDFDEVLLREMAEAGGGSFYFAEDASQLSDFIVGETGEALKVAARDATLVVDLPSGASLSCPNGLRGRSEQRRSVVELGDLVADQVLSLILTVEFPGGTVGEATLVQCWLWDPGGVLDGSTELAWSVVDGGARILDPGAGLTLSRDDELGLAYAMATTVDAVKVAFVRGLLKDGAASHWHPAESAAIVSLSAWGDRGDVPAEAFVACEMVLQGLRRRCPAWDPAVPGHHDAENCWGAFGETPADIAGRIKTDDLCQGCRQLFQAAGVDVDQLLSLLLAVHGLGERPAGLPS